MLKNLETSLEQEIDELSGLLDTPVVAVGMSQDFRNVAEWFAPAVITGADVEATPDQAPFIPFKPSIASATVRRRGIKSAPRCFGSPFLFEPTETDCHNCKFRDRCESQATQQAAGMMPGGRLPASYKDHLMVEPRDNLERAKMRHHIREYYTTQSENSRKRSLVADREYRRKRRAKRGIASIDREFRARLSVLRRAVAASHHDKRLEQLRGREIHLVRAWKAGQLAQLHYGPAASKEKVAQAFRTFVRGAVSYSRHQARNDLRLIDELEKAEHVWGRFKKPAF